MISGQSQVPRKGENSTSLRPSCFSWESTHDEGEKDPRTLLRWDPSATRESPPLMREKKTCFIHISYNAHHCNIPSPTISKYTYVRLFRAICIISVGHGGKFFNFGVVPPAISRELHKVQILLVYQLPSDLKDARLFPIRSIVILGTIALTRQTQTTDSHA